MFIALLALLIGCQIYLEKAGLPERLATMKFRYALLLTLLVIATSMFVGTFLGIGGFLTAAATVVTSVILAHKFRSKYSDMERGKSI